MPENNKNQSDGVHTGDSQAAPTGVNQETDTSSISVPVAPSLSGQQPAALEPKRNRTFAKILLVINGFVLIPTAIMVLSAPFLGPAAIVPGLLLIGILPVVGILLLLDFVLLTVFLVRRMVYKDYTRLKVFLGALAAWLVIIGLFGFQIYSYMQRQRGPQLISRDKAVQLVYDCKIGQFWKQNSYDPTSAPQGEANTLPENLPAGVMEDIQLNYKGSGQGPQTDIANWDALVNAARQSADRCGPVRNGIGSAHHIIGQ